MTKLLDEAIERVRGLPDEQQDDAALNLFAHLAELDRQRRGSLLTDAQVEEVKRIREDIRSGKERIVPSDEMDAFWKSVGA